jgi:ESAT-6 family protein
MATYGLNPNGLLDSGMELRGVTKSVEAALDELNGFVRKFINANAGGAADSYQQAQQLWNNGLIKMNNSLDKGANALDNIRDTYHIADTQGSSLFGGHV